MYCAPEATEYGESYWRVKTNKQDEPEVKERHIIESHNHRNAETAVGFSLLLFPLVVEKGFAGSSRQEHIAYTDVSFRPVRKHPVLLLPLSGMDKYQQPFAKYYACCQSKGKRGEMQSITSTGRVRVHTI